MKMQNEVIRRLYVASIICACFLAVEVIGGLIAHSLAILSDAAHLFADMTSFLVAIAASNLASLPATRQYSFGLKRAESLAALISMTSLALVCIGLAYGAIMRLLYPPEKNINGGIMSIIAAIGILVNVVLAVVLGEDHVHMPGAHDHSHSHDHGHDDEPAHEYGHNRDYQKKAHEHGHNHDHQRKEVATSHDDCKKNTTVPHSHHDHSHGHHETDRLISPTHSGSEDTLHLDEVEAKELRNLRNVNLHAAYLHVMADLAQSVVVFLTGVVIFFRPDWHALDPTLTLACSILVLYSTIGVVRHSISVLMEGIPPEISWEEVYEGISNTPNVSNVHDLHIWSISHGQPALSVHCTSSDPQALSNLSRKCKQFGIVHSTIQIQAFERTCPTCPKGCMCYQSV